MGSLCLPPHPTSNKLGPDARKGGRKGFSDQGDVHSLKLLYNHYLQCRFANAKAEASMHSQKAGQREQTLFPLHTSTTGALRNCSLRLPICAEVQFDQKPCPLEAKSIFSLGCIEQDSSDQTFCKVRGTECNDSIDEDVGINSDRNVENGCNPDLNGADTDLLSSESDNAIPDEYSSDVDQELRSFRAERRNKRNPNPRRKKRLLCLNMQVLDPGQNSQAFSQSSKFTCQNSQGSSQPDPTISSQSIPRCSSQPAPRSSSQPASSTIVCDDTSRVRRVNGIARQKRGRVATGQDSARGDERGQLILDLGSTQVEVEPKYLIYKDASSTEVDLGFKSRGLRWENKDAVSTF
ncbi:hypothetical protein HAX54_021640 [Datura stramonium]|uniref:Uncharacterized protein n=1 Tax=Datura stramonium TaxID=4076 RepID=A0ABS8RK48_DATST|nr:hypothetical protein [Datura stramonium]